MATQRIKFPQFTHSEIIKLIYDTNATHTVRYDDCTAIDHGRFVLAWDSTNAADDYPVIAALCSVTQNRHGELSYGVLCEGGYNTSYKHARVIDAEHLPSVVSSGIGLCTIERVGKLVGFFIESNEQAFITVDINGGIYYLKPEDVAYLSDVKFGIVNEEDNGNS